MRVIPCLNAPGRLASADPGVRALLGLGNNQDIYSCISEHMRINRKRQSLTETITREIDDGLLTKEITGNVIYRADWPIGVLSGVASRVCAEYNRPVVLASPVGAMVIRGTLRVPEGGDAVGILRQVADKLDAWGGHKFAAGFSVKTENWPSVRDELERLLTDIEIIPEEAVSVINIYPENISIPDWKAVCSLGPFGNNNPSPKFYTQADRSEVMPLGKDGKHSYILLNGKRLLAFNTPPREVHEVMYKGVKGWLYHPRLDYWREQEQLQFILDCAVIGGA